MFRLLNRVHGPGFSSDPTGRRIAISDEFQLYFGFVEDLNAPASDLPASLDV